MWDETGGFAATDCRTGTDGCGFLSEIKLWKTVNLILLTRMPIGEFCVLPRYPSPKGVRPVVALARATGSGFDPDGLSLWVEARLDMAWF